MTQSRPYDPAKDFIDTQDYERGELEQLLDLIALLKAADKDGACPELLQDVSLGMIFEEPSTRTRVSFEVAMVKLGGHALYLRPGEIHMGVRESIYDTAKVLSRMCDVIEARTLKHETCVELARWSDVPVINGLTDFNHPTQAICDIFTMREKLGDLDGPHLRVRRRPHERLQLDDVDHDDVRHERDPCRARRPTRRRTSGCSEAQRNVDRYGGSVTVTDDVRDAVADRRRRLHRPVVVGRPGGRDPRAPRGVHADLPGRAPDLMALTRGDCIFMHCLPGVAQRRGDGRR